MRSCIWSINPYDDWMRVVTSGLHYELLLRMREKDGREITPGSFLASRRALQSVAANRPLGGLHCI